MDKCILLIILLVTEKTSGISSKTLNSPIYPFPYYSEVSLCPCDLTEQKCDVSCCCDKDCPEGARQNLTCIAGLAGGQDEGKILTGNCSYQNLFDHDSFSLVCIQRHNSPYLGLYYDEIPHVSDLRSHSVSVDRLKKRSDSSDDVFLQSAISYESGSQFVPSFSFQRGYRFGSPIRTVYDYTDGVDGTVQLPMRVGSACLFSPVRYLKDSHSVCPMRLTPERCHSGRGTILDYQMYLIHPPKGVPISNVPEVLRLGNRSQKIASLHVNYFRVINSKLYLKNQRKNPFKEEAEFKMVDRKEMLIKHIANGGERDVFGREKIEREKMSNILSQIYFDEDEEMCVNIVLEVQYRFFWSGESIDKVEVDIFLGNLTLIKAAEKTSHGPTVPVQSTFQDLSQFFSASFIHQNSKNVKPVQKSGEPGYDLGKPLILANLATSSKPGFKIESLGLQHWSHAKTSSLCRESSPRKVGFMQDTLSGCFIELSRSNFTNCHTLRSATKSIQKKLISGDYLAKGGSLNLTSGDEFIPIIFDERNFVGRFEDRVGDVVHCSVPHHMQVEVMYTRSSKRSSDSFSIFRICGVRVKWSFTRWTWMCRDQKHCDSIQRFPLSMAVDHFEIPIDWHYQNTSRFWVLQDWGFCHGDSCWNELVFPFTHVTTGDEIAYSTACAVFLVPALIFVTWFTRDEW